MYLRVKIMGITPVIHLPPGIDEYNQLISRSIDSQREDRSQSKVSVS